ncbi:tRNA (adenosine(37)-N6)-threonylcarbamoyltransferase complex ATPase subunit type 1 TsaE [Candidatus Acetothermia bacterium]|nr:tRNA (adenosine(37)-N6)-threonylcarbamoyltransferase complex ATPase subunit type 1 TsaE [Candidatus Acetothermia bacterium]
MHDRELLSQNADETRRIGRELAQELKPGDCLVLVGNLGAGKTTLVQGLAAGLGILESVVSPTFTLMREYQGRLPLYHVDAYRIKHLDELREIGLEDTMLAEGIVAIEWGEKAQELLPSGCIEISIDLLSDQYRKIRIRHPA